jgi:hypothetical protein
MDWIIPIYLLIKGPQVNQHPQVSKEATRKPGRLQEQHVY